jgi:hypothetical protein
VLKHFNETCELSDSLLRIRDGIRHCRPYLVNPRTFDMGRKLIKWIAKLIRSQPLGNMDLEHHRQNEPILKVSTEPRI